MIIFWLLGAGATFELSLATQQSYLVVQRLIGELESVRTLISLRQPFLSTPAEPVLEGISQAKKILVELRVAQRTTIIRPDFEHLIRSAESYVDQLERLSQVELDLHIFTEHLRQMRIRYAESTMLIHDFDRIGALVLEAFYAEQEQSKLIYREFNQLYLNGSRLTQEQSTALNRSLAMANQILADYASAEAIIEKLLLNSTFEEKKRIEAQFHHWSHRYHFIYIALTVLSFVWLIVAWRSQRQLLKSKASRQVSSPFNMLHMASLLNNDEAAMVELLAVFVQDHSEDVEKLKQALAVSNDEAVLVIHSLKGVSASLGADGLRELAQHIETRLKNGIAPCEAELERLEKRLQVAVRFAREYVTKDASST